MVRWWWRPLPDGRQTKGAGKAVVVAIAGPERRGAAAAVVSRCIEEEVGGILVVVGFRAVLATADVAGVTTWVWAWSPQTGI